MSTPPRATPQKRVHPTTLRVAAGILVLSLGAMFAVAPPPALNLSALFAFFAFFAMTGLVASGATAWAIQGRHGRTSARPRWHPGLAAGLLLLCLSPGATAFVGMPRGASGRQDAIFDLFVLTTVAALVLTVATLALMLYFAVRYRDRGNDIVASGAPIGPGPRRLVIAAFFLVPTLVIFGIGAVSFDVLKVLDDRPEEGTRIAVTAVQFAWRFEYPDGAITWNDLYVEEGDAVFLELRSEDVVHSLFIPDMGVKMDVNPGMTTETWFRAEEQGTYSAPCAEWCGVGHPEMYARVIVLPAGSAVPPPEAIEPETS